LVITVFAIKTLVTSGRDLTEKQIAVDLVIPTFRPSTKNLQHFSEITIPPKMSLAIFIVVDSHEGLPSGFVGVLEKMQNVHILMNHANLGASLSRNRGIDAGSSEYILFMDDDAEPDENILQGYGEAAEEDPEAPGFVGVSRFSPPINSFTRGTLASDILTFWNISENRAELGWGITANLMVRRSAIGDIRFSSAFPKRGGGEDVDFCLRILQKTGKRFRAAPQAIAHHDWWNEGSRQYRRFARWAYGDGRLPQLHKQYRYYNAPNMTETIFVGTIAVFVLLSLGLASALRLVEWLGLVVISEFGAEIVRLGARNKKLAPITSVEAALVRIANDMGRLAGILKRGHFLGFGERFDYFTTGESISYERKVALSKFALFLIATIALFMIW